MRKNSIASSVIFLGLTCSVVASGNTSATTEPVDTFIESHYEVANNCRNESANFISGEVFRNNSTSLKKLDSAKNNWISKNFGSSRSKLNLELEARNLFGEMREATSEEQKKIQESIEKISRPTGVNFWDYA